MSKPVVLPKYEELTDHELGQWSSRQFADNFIQKAELFSEAFFHKDGWRTIERSADEKEQGLLNFSLSLAWREFYNGVHPPSKQIVMLETVPEDLGIVIRLAQQIIDEVKHQRVWSAWAKHYGGSPRIQDYHVEPDVLRQFHLANDLDDPAEIAASQQCTSEVVVPYLFGYGTLQPNENVAYDLLPEEVHIDIKPSVIADEPRHIAVGKDILIKYCGDAAKRRKLFQLQVKKFQNSIKLLTYDLKMLGAQRVTEYPVVD